MNAKVLLLKEMVKDTNVQLMLIGLVLFFGPMLYLGVTMYGTASYGLVVSVLAFGYLMISTPWHFSAFLGLILLICFLVEMAYGIQTGHFLTIRESINLINHPQQTLFYIAKAINPKVVNLSIQYIFISMIGLYMVLRYRYSDFSIKGSASAFGILVLLTFFGVIGHSSANLTIIKILQVFL